MDPVTAVVVSAIAAGVVAGVGDTATQAVKDAYAGLKNLLARRYGGVDVSAVERRPDSEAKRAALAEDLDEAGAAGDAELGRAAVAVLEAVREHAPGVAVGVEVSGLVSAALTIAAVDSTGHGVRVADSRIDGATEIRGVRSGVTVAPGTTAAPG